MTYIDVTPGPAASAARATAATSGPWESWAARSEKALRGAASSSRESVVTAAFESYLGDLNPRLKSVANLAEGQGVNLATAVNLATDTDRAAQSGQNDVLAGSESLNGTVSRPINVPR
ncbi:MAG: hypothetical protein ACRDQA_19775 [Nocardioidaceae bacterium]